MPRTKKEVQDHVRRIENAYYYDTYRNLTASQNRDEELELGSNTSSEPTGNANQANGNAFTPLPLPSATTGHGPSTIAATYTSTNTTGKQDGVDIPPVVMAHRNSSSSSSACMLPQGSEPCLVSGNGNRPLTESVALVLGVKTHNTAVFQYESGEVNVEIRAPLIGKEVYIIQSMISNNVVDVNTSVMELLLLIRKIRLQHPRSISAIIPFFGYSRQDRKTNLRGAVPAAAVARMITRMGVDRVATLDLHSNQIQGYFDSVPLDNLGMMYEFAKYIREKEWFKNKDKVCVVSPDAGGVERAGRLADVLQVDRIVTILKRRMNGAGADGCLDEYCRLEDHTATTASSNKNRSKIHINTDRTTTMQTAGEVKGLHCIVVDDIVDTATTLAQACTLLKELGAASIMACCTHGSLSPPAATNISRCDCLDELVVSDSIPQEEHQREIPKLKVVTIAPLLAAVVKAYEEGRSLSCLFPKR